MRNQEQHDLSLSTVELLIELEKAVTRAKELQVIVINRGEDLTIPEREGIVKVWNALDVAGEAMFRISETRKKEGR